MSDFASDNLSAVALFPLPNVVLLPSGVLPLHIFEPRYKEMTQDVLSGQRMLAMALLKPGWEQNYYGRPAIEPVVCVGQIVSYEQLPDGTYNFLLQGRQRARVLRELTGKAYRRADLQPIVDSDILEIDLEVERRRLVELFTDGAPARMPSADHFRRLLNGPLPTQEVADLLAFTFLDDVMLKQRLLGEADVHSRVSSTVDALAEMHPPASPGLFGLPEEPSNN